MSVRDLDSAHDRERLEKLFQMSPQDKAIPAPIESAQQTERQLSGRLQPYLLAAAATLIIVGFWYLLAPLQNEPVKKEAESISISPSQPQAPAVSSHRHMQPLNHFTADKLALTGIVDARTLTTSYYWTVIVKNNAEFRQEARGRLKLPEGAVVSRVTEWINGIPQEAAFNTVDATNFAYENVVAQKRDPLIVNCKGDGIVAFKAFPVNPHGGIVKIRLGITSPMTLNDEGICSVAAPYLISSNFACEKKEELHIEGRSMMTASQDQGLEPDMDISTEPAPAGNYTIRAHVSQSQLESLRINSQVLSDLSGFAIRATHSPKGHYIRFSLKQNHDGHGFVPNLSRTTTKPNLPIVNDESAAFRLSNLWAAEEVDRLNSGGRRKVAERMGSVFRLVTPVSSAVVLESSRDYKRYGLHKERYAVITDQTPPPEKTLAVADISAGLSGSLLQGATNGTVGPQGADATVIEGVNTAGTVICIGDPALDFVSKVLGSFFQLCLVFIAILSVAKLAQFKWASLGWSKK